MPERGGHIFPPLTLNKGSGSESIDIGQKEAKGITGWGLWFFLN
jgi:hypothetical protein